LALVFSIVFVFTAKTVKFVMDIWSETCQLVIFTQDEPQTHRVALIVESKELSPIWQDLHLELLLISTEVILQEIYQRGAIHVNP
jgi:hypothetical protein